MYNPKGKLIFFILVAAISFQISFFGKLVFGMLLGMGCVYMYVSFKHPKFHKYMQRLHYYGQQSYGNAVDARPTTVMSPMAGGQTSSGHAPLPQSEQL